MNDLDPRDRELLTALQADFPLSSTPYAVIGQRIDMSEKEVLKRSEKLRRDGILRHIAGSFDAKALGYSQSLVAASVEEERLDHAGSVVNLHPGVTQNYQRNHAYNLWFTLAVPPDSSLGFDGTLERLAETAQWKSARVLSTLRSFKAGAESEESSHGAIPTAGEIEVIRHLQRDLPLHPRPYDSIARVASLQPDVVVTAVQEMARRGQLRHINAAVQTRRNSFSATAMGVWAVDDDKAATAGTTMAQHAGVAQCYLRPTYEDWPYNLFTTVQGRSVDECEALLAELAETVEYSDRRVLFPVKEFKRARLNLFSPDIAQWEASRGGELTVTAAS